MRRMITGKQQEFVEELGEAVKVIEGETPGVQIGSEDSGVKVYGNASYKSVDLLTTDDVERFGVGYDGLTYNMFLGDNTIKNGLTIENNMLTFHSGGDGSGSINFLGNSFYGDESGLNISNNYGETAGISLTNEGNIEMSADGNIIMFLPTSDPHVEGALWNDNGTLKISAGGN